MQDSNHIFFDKLSIIFSQERLDGYLSHAKCNNSNSNWPEIERIAHKIKSGALYIGTQRLFYACQYLERYHKAGHSLMLDKLYKQLLLVNEETLKTVEEWLKNNS